MNRQTLQYLFLITVLGTFTIEACKDDDENNCIGGSGGSLTMVVKLAHHGVLIPNDSLRPDTLWIKYNVSDWSGAPAGYDKMLIGEYPEDHIHVSGMKCGKYYLYASGWDVDLGEVVRGGIPYETDKSSGEITVTVPVTE